MRSTADITVIKDNSTIRLTAEENAAADRKIAELLGITLRVIKPPVVMKRQKKPAQPYNKVAHNWGCGMGRGGRKPVSVLREQLQRIELPENKIPVEKITIRHNKKDESFEVWWHYKRWRLMHSSTAKTMFQAEDNRVEFYAIINEEIEKQRSI